MIDILKDHNLDMNDYKFSNILHGFYTHLQYSTKICHLGLFSLQNFETHTLQVKIGKF